MRLLLSILALCCLAAGWPSDIPPLPPAPKRAARGVTQGAGAAKLVQARVVIPGGRTNTFTWRYPIGYLAPVRWELHFSTNMRTWTTIQTTTNSATSFTVNAPNVGRGFWRVKGVQ